MTSPLHTLCQACGLCCNGVLFRDVELAPGRERNTLADAGLPVQELKRKCVLPQPCAALQNDLRCAIYAQRPGQCRRFECLLYKSVETKQTSQSDALKIIASTRRAAARVERLLARLGDDRTDRSLARRFQRTRTRMHRLHPDEEALDTFAELTLAVHDLNMRLRRHFYP